MDTQTLKKLLDEHPDFELYNNFEGVYVWLPSKGGKLVTVSYSLNVFMALLAFHSYTEFAVMYDYYQPY